MSSSNFMEKVQDKLQAFLVPIADRLNSQRHLSSLKDGMTVTIPLTIIGGFFMLLAQPPVNADTMQATNFFFKLLLNWKAWAVANSALLNVPFNLTIGALSLYVVFAVAYYLAKGYKLNSISCGVGALFIFTLTAVAPYAVENTTVINIQNLGAQGMFYSIIVAFITVEVFRFFITRNIKIKLPEQVPPNVAAPFEALIPVVVLTVVFFLANILCTNMTGNNLCRLVFTLLAPLMTASSSLISVIIISILLSAFWFLGIHGNNLVGGVLTPITTANLALNAEYYINGVGSPTPLSGAFITIFGNWMSYPAMMVCFFLVAKSAHLKSIRNLAIIPDLFNINEPLTFGLPVVMNVLLALPIMICNVVTCTIAYLLMKYGIVGSIYISIPWTTPGIINLFLATMDVKAIIMWAALFALDIVVLMPFVKIYDKQMLAEETGVIEETQSVKSVH